MAVPQLFISWPGIQNVEASFSYCMSHKITPDTAVVRILPQATFPGTKGNLTVRDIGGESFTLGNCKLSDVRMTNTSWMLSILDKRWRWAFGRISGAYNQLDDHGKLIPWTIRSLTELCTLCLQAMGEPNFDIRMPPGLSSLDGQRFALNNPSYYGVQPSTSTNPPINWGQDQNPAQALADLCEKFGRRIISRLNSVVLIAPMGVGGELPPGSLSSQSLDFDSPELPSGAVVCGSPTVYEGRLWLEAVGEEWNGHLVPINSLSYAPLVPGRPQITTFSPENPCENAVYTVNIGPHMFAYTATGGDTEQTIASYFQGAIQGGQPLCTATVLDHTVTLTGVNNSSFTVTSSVVIPPVNPNLLNPAMFQQTLQTAESGGVSWAYSNPSSNGGFMNVRATSRLSHQQARELAMKTVYRYYRLSDSGIVDNPVDPENSPITVPGYGTLLRRQQIILHDKMVQQILPSTNPPDLVGANQQQVTVAFYNGYSRSRPPEIRAMTGVVNMLQNAFHRPVVGPGGITRNIPLLTLPGDIIYFDFSIDSARQLVIFNKYVYGWTTVPINGVQVGKTTIPGLMLQTGFNVRNAYTNELECYKLAVNWAGRSSDTQPVAKTFEDIQLQMYGVYNDQLVGPGPQPRPVDVTALLRVELIDADAISRAQFYMSALTAQYEALVSYTNTYNGVKAIDLDGRICQVSYETSEAGVYTIASVNSEHAHYLPNYPARRKLENIPPVMSQRLGDALMTPVSGLGNWYPR